MSIFRGSGVALVTPMKENGEVNYDSLEALLEDQMARVHLGPRKDPGHRRDGLEQYGSRDHDERGS